MKFNKLTYYIPNNTKHKTNLKSFENLKDGYTFYVDFKLDKFIENEACVIGRQDEHYMGLFLQNPNAIKFCWHNKDNTYTDIFIEIDDVYENMRVLVTISDEIKIYKDGFFLGSKKCNNILDYNDKNILIGSINPHFEQWECAFDGVINEVKIFEGITTNPNDTSNLYSHLTFEELSRFKTLDVSGNGNHGVYYEDPVYRNEKINEYNKIGPKQKIV